MKLKIGAHYWTDYPFVELGDVPKQKAPVRKVTLISFDGNKHCDVLVEKPEVCTVSVKAGYLYTKPQRIADDGFVDVCEFCGEDEPCDKWKCRVEMNRREGCPEHTPNNLPVRCIRADGTMLEHEHGDHPDYIFPVHIEYIGPKDESRYFVYGGQDDEPIAGESVIEGYNESIDNETHALLYTNGSIAVTMYETCSAAWMLQEDKQFRDGKEVVIAVAGTCIGGHMWKAGEWKLSDESLKNIADHLKKKWTDIAHGPTSCICKGADK